ncbi:hypothetical protein DACRYDRAFT_92816 [Dacryopinax primogenitus]|uniref:cAMP-independent regulatory protein pac2 n=1 Tax=Dacryopinax primogenitus (strain DJM 731) TaxID=1858805 RepID=M5G9Q8_DACPD|nr:uncharacterized protein DACRYDRAFT_92816 [Dacryopinax primogenitus]EJU05544.1 hypothetical protein DACRYDRAFT_92816 [Dacryopinax primogenitus]
MEDHEHMLGSVKYQNHGPSISRMAVSSQHDALVVFEAARRGLIPVMRHRLTENEKDIHIVPGTVYVWEEANASDRSSRCLRRWTDGVKWSQSRMREPFLFYEEVPPFERTEADRRNKTRHPSRRDRIIKPDGLKKLTFTALVRLSPDDPMDRWAKWHLVCYMTQNDRTVPAVSEHPELSQVEVPDGVFYDCKGIALDNAPRQTVKWPREPLTVDTMSMAMMSPPHSDRDSPLYSPVHGPSGKYMVNMPVPPMSPPASPGEMDHRPYSHYPHPPYTPDTPPHIALAPPGRSSYSGRPEPGYHGLPTPSPMHAPARHPRLPGLADVLRAHLPDLDGPDPTRQSGRPGPQLPPLSQEAQWGWTRRRPEDARALHALDRPRVM